MVFFGRFYAELSVVQKKRRISYYLLQVNQVNLLPVSPEIGQKKRVELCKKYEVNNVGKSLAA